MPAAALPVHEAATHDLLDAEQGVWLCAGGSLPDELLTGGLAGGLTGGGGGPAGGCGDSAGRLVGAGFDQDGALDRLLPGPELGLLLPGAEAMAELGDDELTGVVRGWRRMSSWAAAMELAAVAELARRRVAEAESAGARVSEADRFAAAEVAAALRLTRCAAEGLVGRAIGLVDLSATLTALASGVIDVPRALVIGAGLAGLDASLCRRVEEQVLGKASAQTTAQLGRAVARAALAADPAAADKRRTEAEKSARVERWAESAGTAAIAGRDLAPADVLAADNRVNALATALKASGAEGSMDLLRAQVFVGLLLGRPAVVADACAAPTGGVGDASAEPGAAADARAAVGGSVAGDARAAAGGSAVEDASAADASAADAGLTVGAAPTSAGDGRVLAEPRRTGWAGMTGSVNLTVPLTTLLGLSRQPGEVAGFGPVGASAATEIAAVARHSPWMQWCVTLTDKHGRPAGHGCVPRGTPVDDQGDWVLTVTVRALAGGVCRHSQESPAYHPSPSLRHLIEIRHATCVFPGCGRPARRCDKDHTIAYDAGGRTCECNLAPLCRFHHRVKQANGWHLAQPSPGVLLWTSPSGWKYDVTATGHPT